MWDRTKELKMELLECINEDLMKLVRDLPGSSKRLKLFTPEKLPGRDGTAAAGEMMSLTINLDHGNLINTISLGPVAMQTQQALQGELLVKVLSSR